MGMNALDNLSAVLKRGDNEIFVGEELRLKAMKPLRRMLDFAAANK
jgi:quinolinate synthase